MPPFTRKKLYTNRCIREMTMEPRVLVLVAKIIIMLILMVSTTI